MAASVHYRQQQRSLGLVMMKEKEDDLALFLEMRSREMERNNLLLLSSDGFDDHLGSEHDCELMSMITSTLPAPKTRVDEFLNAEHDKTDYDWLLTPPGTPLFPSLDMESNKTAMSQIGISTGRPAAPKSMLANSSSNNEASRQPFSSIASNSSIAANRRPSSSGGLTPTVSRPSTPTRRATLPAKAKPSRSSTPTSRATLPATSKPSRPSTPSSRATLPSNKPTASTVRSSTPTRSIARSCTPTSKSSSRSATPTRLQATPPSVANSLDPSDCSSALTKTGAKTLNNNPLPSRRTSPTVKTSVPKRPASASRGRPIAHSAQSSSIETSSNGRPRRQSCSPSRGRAPNGIAHNNGISVIKMSRAHSNGNDVVSPVLMGTKMVERVVNTRKLAPPKEDESMNNNTSSGKSLSSQENPGLGRSLSKKSFDMALRHMDIRRSIPGNLRPLMTKIPASCGRSKTLSVSDSPLATSSNASSSEPSVNYNSHYLELSEVEIFDVGDERGYFSPSFLQDG